MDVNDKSGCEFGRHTKLRLDALEKTVAKNEEDLAKMCDKIFARLDSWWPKPMGIVITVFGTLIGALLSALIAVIFWGR